LIINCGGGGSSSDSPKDEETTNNSFNEETLTWIPNYAPAVQYPLF